MTTSPHCSPRDPQAPLGLARGPRVLHLHHRATESTPLLGVSHTDPSTDLHQHTVPARSPDPFDARHMFLKPPKRVKAISFRSWEGMVRGARSRDLGQKEGLKACLFLDVASSRAQTRSGKTRALIDSPYQSASFIVAFVIPIIFPSGSKKWVNSRRLDSPTFMSKRR